MSGASGSLGRRVVALLCRDPERRVLALDRSPLPFGAPGLEFLLGDVHDPDLARCFEAATPSSSWPSWWSAAAAETEAINLGGTRHSW